MPMVCEQEELIRRRADQYFSTHGAREDGSQQETCQIEDSARYGFTADNRQ